MAPGSGDAEDLDPLRIPGYQGLLVHAMIATAEAGGGINPEQKLIIARQAMKAGIETGHDARYRRAMEKPWTPRKLAHHCENQHQRLAVYQAACFTAQPGSAAASGFLEALYIVLGISRDQRAALQRKRPDSAR